MLRLLFTVAIIALHLHSAAKTSFSFAGSKVELLDRAEAAALNGSSDLYTKALTPFDLAIRLDKPAGATEKDYLQRAAAAVQDWPADEAADLQRAFVDVEAFLTSRKIKLPLPPVIQMIKTDGTEEFGAEGYTRGARIMLNTAAQAPTMHLVAHELFHVVSRANPPLRDRVYAVFGFKPCRPIDLKAALPGRLITNPDCPVVEHYIELIGKKNLESYVLVLYSKQDYKAGSGVDEYAAVGLLLLNGAGQEKSPAMKGGWGILSNLENRAAFFQKVGTNTQYLLHPEEISAEHFAMLVTGKKVQEEHFLTDVEAALRNP